MKKSEKPIIRKIQLENIHYKTILAGEFAKRRRLLRRYSLRQFSKDIGILPSHLCEVLKGKKNISQKKAETISAMFPLTPIGQRHFQYLVGIRGNRSLYRKMVAWHHLRKSYIEKNKVEISYLTCEPKGWRQEVQFWMTLPTDKFKFHKYHLNRRVELLGLT